MVGNLDTLIAPEGKSASEQFERNFIVSRLKNFNNGLKTTFLTRISKMVRHLRSRQLPTLLNEKSGIICCSIFLNHKRYRSNEFPFHEIHCVTHQWKPNHNNSSCLTSFIWTNKRNSFQSIEFPISHLSEIDIEIPPV